MKILLLGEIEFTSAYFKRICELKSWALDNIYSYEPIIELGPAYDLYIISDYPSSQLDKNVRRSLVREVRKGKGLLMVGGWSSFSGLDGNYGNTEIGKILPVRCQENDDRVNVWGGAHLKLVQQHWIVSALDWSNPPVICGYNKTIPREESEVIVKAENIFSQHFPESCEPMLAITKYGKGRVSAYMSDLVPHWCAGLLDWGDERSRIRGFEFGQHYISFVSRLFAWTARKEKEI